jgi:acetolactate synthase I/II/III large subunit
MAMVNGGDLFVKALKKEGVKYIFSLCGGHLNPIYSACISEGVEIVDVRHEQVAAHAAAGWARATGEPGVSVVTAGPGLSDSVTGVAEAFTAGIPMIQFGGRTALRDFDRGALQDVDQVRLMEPITKWARPIYEAKRIPEYVSMAFRIAKSGTPGPVYIECPVDVLSSQVEDSEVAFPQQYYAENDSGGSPSKIKQAIELLMGAERPVVIAGSGLFWAKSERELQEFVELTEIPVQTADLAKGAVPEDHALNVAAGATAMADVVLALGLKFDFLQGHGGAPLFDAKAKFIQVNTDGAVIGYNRGAEIGIVGSPRTVLRQLIDEIKKTNVKVNRSAWINQVQSFAKMMEEAGAAAYCCDSQPIHPARLAKEVTEFVTRDTIVVVDGGDGPGGWFATHFKAKRMGQVLGTGPFGCLGLGTGLALAAKLAHPDRPVLGYFGDGSFGLNGMEFDTYVRHSLPIVSLISNDSGWGMVKQWQIMDYGADRCRGMLLKAHQRYDKMVEALGGHGEYVDKIEDIKPALARAFASGLPALVNVVVDPQPVSIATVWLHDTMK